VNAWRIAPCWSLRVYTEKLRTKRDLRAAEQTAKIALKPRFRLMFFIVPTPPAVLIGPYAVRAVSRLFPIMAARSGG
jgi:tight adherence protein C